GDSISDKIPVLLTVTSDKGCVDTALRFLRVDPDITVFIPSAFRPVSGANNAPCADAEFADCNDVFRVYADGFKSIEIFVFNRWGQQVFSTDNPKVGWNGKINNTGVACPQDVYIYQINAKSMNDRKYTYSGSVTLLK
ncbi:MAG: gliding motility-associated C-terminal domain-containing protein, partial [Bacteroidota bacterium]